MKIARVRINNILGIEELDFQPGATCVVSGPNGIGKSSILEALKGALGGGHDGSLLRNGASEGEVVLVFDEGHTLDMTVTREKTQRTVEEDGKGIIKQPVSWLRSAIDQFSMNPVSFLTAPARKAPSSKQPSRTELLLEALPLEVTADDINACVPKDHRVIPAEIKGSHALLVIGALSQRIFDERTGINRLHVEKDKAFKVHKENLPPKPRGGDWAKEVESLQAQLNEDMRAYEAEKGEIQGDLRVAETEAEGQIGKDRLSADAKYAQGVGAAEAVYEAAVAEAKRIRAEEIKRLDGILRSVIEGAVGIRDAALDAARRSSAARMEMLESATAPKLAKLQGEIGEAKARADQQKAAESAEQFVLQLDREARQYKAESDDLTKSLDRLGALKSRLLEKLPIPGLEVRGDGEIYVDGVPFDRINASRRVRIAIEIAALRVGRLPLIIADGLEQLDSESFAAFETEMERASEERGIQFIISRVQDSEGLTITSR